MLPGPTWMADDGSDGLDADGMIQRRLQRISQFAAILGAVDMVDDDIAQTGRCFSHR